jgi:hypothetical protein
MPIGYIVNKRYVIDTLYDRYADLDVSKRIAREASKRGYGCHVYYSATARGYCCEIRKFENKFKHSAHIYFLTEGHKYGPNPLEAMCRAVRQCIPLDPLMRVLLLEAEAVQLGIEIKDRRAVEDRLERALTDLRAVLDTIPISFWHGDRHIGTHAIGELRGRPIQSLVYIEENILHEPRADKKPPVYDKDRDFGDEYQRWSNIIAGKPAVPKPDLDDDL